MSIKLRWVAAVALGVAACHAHVGAGIGDPPPSNQSAAIRYEVSQILPAVTFYKQLGFDVWKCETDKAVLHRGDLTLLLEAPRTPGNKPAVEATPEDSNAWNRIVLYVDDLHAQLDRVQRCGGTVRANVPERNGVVISDPDGNPVEIRQLGRRVAWQ